MKADRFRWLGQAAALWAVFCLNTVHWVSVCSFPTLLVHASFSDEHSTIFMKSLLLSRGLLFVPAGLLIDRFGAFRSALLGLGLVGSGVAVLPWLFPYSAWAGAAFLALGFPLASLSLIALTVQRQTPFSLRLALTVCGLQTFIDLGAIPSAILMLGPHGRLGLHAGLALVALVCVAGIAALLGARRHCSVTPSIPTDTGRRGFGWALLVLLAAVASRHFAGIGQAAVNKAWVRWAAEAVPRNMLTLVPSVVGTASFFLSIPFVLLIVRLLPRGELGAAIRLSLSVVLSTALFLVGNRLAALLIEQGAIYGVCAASLTSALADVLGLLASLELAMYWLPLRRQGTALGVSRACGAAGGYLRGILGT